MSHEETIICPNCGSEAIKNYCSQCGQATHLHDETFGSLLSHFFAHYFHYESKFWQTIKVLITKPGALTVAYRNKQRMRYVQPMSLYIFTVVAYFILSTLVEKTYEKLHIGEEVTNEYKQPEEQKINVSSNPFMQELKYRVKYTSQHIEEYEDKILKLLPKIFFFMVPAFAVFLKLFFHRKNSFLDHVIFSFHLHTIFFFILFLTDLFSFPLIYDWVLLLAGLLGFLLYCTRSMTNVYNTTTIRALIYSAVTISLHFMIFAVVFFATMLLVVHPK